MGSNSLSQYLGEGGTMRRLSLRKQGRYARMQQEHGHCCGDSNMAHSNMALDARCSRLYCLLLLCLVQSQRGGLAVNGLARRNLFVMEKRRPCCSDCRIAGRRWLTMVKSKTRCCNKKRIGIAGSRQRTNQETIMMHIVTEEVIYWIHLVVGRLCSDASRSMCTYLAFSRPELSSKTCR